MEDHGKVCQLHLKQMRNYMDFEWIRSSMKFIKFWEGLIED